ncbi:hypothetical protein [Chromatium okenii]
MMRTDLVCWGAAARLAASFWVERDETTVVMGTWAKHLARSAHLSLARRK